MTHSLAGLLPQALKAVNKVLGWHEVARQRTNAAADTITGTAACGNLRCPVAVVCCVYHMLSRVGEEGVKELQRELGGELHPHVVALCQQWKTWL